MTKNKSQLLKLTNSSWMFHPRLDTYYSERFEFIQFTEDKTVLYYDIDGGLIKKDDLIEAEDRSLLMPQNTFFEAVEILAHDQLHLIYSLENLYQDGGAKKTKMKLFYTKIEPTIIKIDQLVLETIIRDSKWKAEETIGKQNKIISIRQWIKMSPEDRSKIRNDIKNKMLVPDQYHLIRFENCLILLQEKFDQPTAKGLVKSISEEKMIIQMLPDPNRLLMLNRKK